MPGKLKDESIGWVGKPADFQKEIGREKIEKEKVVRV